MNPKLSLLLGILCISFSPIFVKMVPMNAPSIAFYRIFIGWMFLAPYCLLKVDLKISTADLFLAILGGLIFAADIAVWNVSLLKISATVSTLLANLAPIWVGLMMLLLFKKRPGLNFWAGTLISIAGMAVLVGVHNLIALKLSAGIIYALAASVLYACYIIISKQVLSRVFTLSFMFYNMLAASSGLLIYCLVTGSVLAGFSVHTWFILLALGLICQLTGWITINYAISHLDPTKVAVALLSQTVIAAMLASVLLKETITVNTFVGGAVVLAGIGLTFLKKTVVT
jgi:drug/metabolite transporter (DMT)-like permease